MALAFLSGPLQAHILVPKAVNLGVSGPAKTLFESIGQPKLCSKSEQWYTCKHVARRWKASNNDMPAASNDFDLSQYRLAEVTTVRQEQLNGKQRAQGPPSWVVLLKMQDLNKVLAVYVGDPEGSSLKSELPAPVMRQQPRPLTYDLMKNSLTALGARVTKVCITALVEQTYYASVHYARAGHTDEIVIDSRPSDAINLAVRFGAPVYVKKEVAERMGQEVSTFDHRVEAPAEIEVSCRAVLNRYHDPTILHKINMQVAVQENRFEDAAKIRNDIERILSSNRTLSLVVALESALGDKRWEEAAFLRDQLVVLVDAVPEQKLQDA